MKIGKLIKLARDIQTAKKCKSWIELETKLRYEDGLINHLRINAIYIENGWEKPFTSPNQP